MATVLVGNLIEKLMSNRAREAILVPGAPPTLRRGKEFIPISAEKLTPDDVRQVLINLRARSVRINSPLEEAGHFSFGVSGVGRFRVSYVTQRGSYAVFLHVVEEKTPSLWDLVPDDDVRSVLQEVQNLQNGLIFITGPYTICNTDLAGALLLEILTNRAAVIYTLEQPQAYSLRHNRSIVVQREVGSDVPDFAEGIADALRIAADVIYIGDIPDTKTAEAALRAVESGRLIIITYPSGGIVAGLISLERYFADPITMRQSLAHTLYGIFSPSPLTTGESPALAMEWLLRDDEITRIIEDGNFTEMEKRIKTTSRLTA
ncbi:MAG: Flp pilus assembly complex ATPase component TadA [Candidatus Hydrothermae bacterium]|nr:Flp pilus assembly complex ATPase component TadA [Candidatus Hydrothermae bacterium]